MGEVLSLALPHMPRTMYVNVKDVNELQEKIMLFVDKWVHEKKTPISQKVIIATMLEGGVKPFTTIKALNVLLVKGYIRRAVTISNKTTYVQLRRV